MSDYKKMTLADIQRIVNNTLEYVNGKAVCYSEVQTLTDTQKSLARSNIGAGTSSLTEEDVNTLIDTKLGVIENASY